MVQNLVGASLAVKYTRPATYRYLPLPMPSKAQPSASAAADEASAPARRKPSTGVSTQQRADRASRQEDLLGDSLAYAIKRTQVRCDEALARYLDPGLSPARFAALSTVGANPGISQAALSGLLNIAGPSVVKVVDDLERMGLMRRETSSDRRVYALKLTDKGTDDLKRYQSSIRTYEKKIAALLTPQERTQLFALLAKVAANEP
jgi:DNA-binding MarR family transcriptional regulator